MNQTIRRVTFIPVRVPVPRERINCPEFAHEPLNRGPTGGWDGPFFADVPFYIIRVEGSGGPSGWGDTSRAAEGDDLERCARLLLGKAPRELDPRVSPGPEWASRGLMTAALDWRARIEGVPLHQLFGPRLRQGIEVADWTGFRTPAGAAAFARAVQDRGWSNLKIKAGLETDSAGIAREIFAACGPDFHLVIDPNGRWLDLDHTLALARAIVAVNPNVMLEDPVYEEAGLDVMARTRKETGIGMISTPRFLWRLHKAAWLDAVDGFNLTGNWAQVCKMSDAARDLNLPYWCGSSVETGLADVATIHFGVTQEMFRIPCELGGHMTREHAMISRQIEYRGAVALPPDGPGLGVDADQDALERYRVGDPVVVE